LLVFRELLRTGSASRAAERLGLSQSAVSHALGRLRALHHDPLFVRRPHGFEPTRRARELAPHVERLVELAASIYADAGTFDPSTSDRRFSVAAPEFVMATLGGELLGRWSTAAPGVSLVTRQLNQGEIVDRLRRGEIDLGIGRFASRQPAGIAREVLYRDQYCVAARRDHPTIHGSLDRDAYLSVGHVVASSPSEGEPDEEVPPAVSVIAVVPAWLAALTIVSSSNAIATCPQRLAAQHAAPLQLQVVAVPGRPLPIEVAALWRSDERPDPGVEWLRHELRACSDQVRNRSKPSRASPAH
jgi:DNA-binding transcriptional LysR family regulator